MRLYRVLGLFGVLVGAGSWGDAQSCPAGVTTTVSGVVYAPNGTDPLPNVFVYVPSAPLELFPAGVACVADGTPPAGSPITQTVTAVDGSFQLQNVPEGTNVPLVVQIGKWRRQVTVPTVTACTNTAFSTRLPKNHGEGDIPMIAMVTGRTDQMECALRDIGLEDAEFTDPGGNGRINLYLSDQNPGAQISAQTPSESSLMGNPATLNQYDIVLVASAGAVAGANPPPYPPGDHEPPFYADQPQLPARPQDQLQNFANYVNAGGRAFLTHLQSVYIEGNPYLPAFARWSDGSQWADGQDYLDPAINTSFDEGAQFAEWLPLTNSGFVYGQMMVNQDFPEVVSVTSPTQSWYSLTSKLQNGNTGTGVQQFVAHTPVGASNACGRVVYDDFLMEVPPYQHYPTNVTFPNECVPRFQQPQEYALEWNLFELTKPVGGSASTLTPGSFDFGSVAVGFSSATETFTWTNGATVTASATPAIASADFAVVSSTCGSVVSGGSCQIGVQFKPASVGQKTTLLKVDATGQGGVTTAFLLGNGVAPLSLSATELQFYSIPVGASKTLSLKVMNIAPGPVPLPPLVVTGDYAATSNCGGSVPAHGSCTIFVTFTPTAGGLRSGTLTVGISPVVELEGVGNYYELSVTPASASVIAGESTTLSVVITPEFGYTGTVKFGCGQLPAGVTCSSAGSVTLSGTAPATAKVTVQTTSKYQVIGYGGMVWFVGLGTGLIVLLRRRKTARIVALMLLIGCFGLNGCSGKYPGLNSPYTPAGTYTLTVTGDDGRSVESADFTLVVAAK